MAEPTSDGTQEKVGEEILAEAWVQGTHGGGLMGAIGDALSKKDDNLPGPKGNVILAVTPAHLAILETEGFGLTRPKAGNVWEKIPRDQVRELKLGKTHLDRQEVTLDTADGRHFSWTVDEDNDHWIKDLQKALKN